MVGNSSPPALGLTFQFSMVSLTQYLPRLAGFLYGGDLERGPSGQTYFPRKALPAGVRSRRNARRGAIHPRIR